MPLRQLCINARLDSGTREQYRELHQLRVGTKRPGSRLTIPGLSETDAACVCKPYQRQPSCGYVTVFAFPLRPLSCKTRPATPGALFEPYAQSITLPMHGDIDRPEGPSFRPFKVVGSAYLALCGRLDDRLESHMAS